MPTLKTATDLQDMLDWLAEMKPEQLVYNVHIPFTVGFLARNTAEDILTRQLEDVGIARYMVVDKGGILFKDREILIHEAAAGQLQQFLENYG